MVCCHHLPPMRLHPNTTSEAWKLKPSSLGPLDMTSVYRQVLTDCMVYGYARGQTITIEATAATTTTTITTAKATDNNNYNHDHNPFATTPRRTNPPTDQHKTPLETMCNDPMNSNYRNRFCLHTSSQEFMSAAIADCIWQPSLTTVSASVSSLMGSSCQTNFAPSATFILHGFATKIPRSFGGCSWRSCSDYFWATYLERAVVNVH